MDIIQEILSLDEIKEYAVIEPKTLRILGDINGEPYIVDVDSPEAPAGTPLEAPTSFNFIEWDERFYVSWDGGSGFDEYYALITNAADDILYVIDGLTKRVILYDPTLASDLSNDTEYTLQVIGVKGGDVYEGAEVNFTLRDKQVQNVSTVGTSDTQAEIEWDALTTDFNYYKVFLKDVASGQIIQEVNNAQSNSIIFSGLTPLANYEVWVTAVSEDEIFESESSVVLEFTAQNVAGNLQASYVIAAEEVPEGYTAVSTPEDLRAINNDLTGKYYLTNDIDLSTYGNWIPIGLADDYTVVGNFTGVFDGGGHTIDNFSCDQDVDGQSIRRGLFRILSGAIVRRLSFTNAYHKGNTSLYCGTLAGQMSNSYIDNVSAVGTFRANFDRAGGLIGYTNNPFMHNCWASMEHLDSGSRVGGLVGFGDGIDMYSNSFYNSDLAGGGSSTPFGVGRTGAQMIDQSTYTGYIFPHVWTMEDGVSLPTLVPATQPTIKATWDGVFGADGYNLYTSEDGGAYTKVNDSLITENEYLIRGLSGEENIIVVRAVVGGVEGVDSNTYEVPINYFETDFEEYATGNILSTDDWILGEFHRAINIVTPGGVIGDKMAEQTAAGAGSFGDVVLNSHPFLKGEILGLVGGIGSSFSAVGIGISSEVLRIYEGGDQVTVNGWGITASTTAHPVSTADYLWVRINYDVVAGTLKIKWWVRGDAEPASWNFEDTINLVYGSPSLVYRESAYDKEWHYIATSDGRTIPVV